MAAIDQAPPPTPLPSPAAILEKVSLPQVSAKESIELADKTLAAVKKVFEPRQAAGAYDELRALCPRGIVACGCNRDPASNRHPLGNPEFQTRLLADRPLLNRLQQALISDHDERYWTAQHVMDALVMALVEQAAPSKWVQAPRQELSADPVSELRKILLAAAGEMRLDKKDDHATQRAGVLLMRFKLKDWGSDYKLSAAFAAEAGGDLERLMSTAGAAKKMAPEVYARVNFCSVLGEVTPNGARGLLKVVESGTEKQALLALNVLKHTRGAADEHQFELATLLNSSPYPAVKKELATLVKTRDLAAKSIPLASLR